MSKTKGGGSTRNGRDSNAQRLGVKVFDGTAITRRHDRRPPARHALPPGPQRRPGPRRHAVRQGRRQGEVRLAPRASPRGRRTRRGLTPGGRWPAFSRKGSLLVASPTLADPNFFRSVVFMLAHDDDDGSLGVVLNRPSPVPVDEIVPGWGALAATPSVLFIGGPGPAERGDLHRADRAPRGGRGGRLRAPARRPRHGRPARGPRSTCPVPPGRGPRLHRLCGLGAGPARRRDRLGILARAHGHRTRTCSRATPKGCGPGCCAARAAGSRCSPSTRPTWPRTDLAVRALRWPRLRRRVPGPRERRQRGCRGCLVPPGGARLQGRP